MPIIDTNALSDDVVVFDRDQCSAAGEALHPQYASADPFPHIMLENFIAANVLRPLLAEWPEGGAKVGYDRAQERLKYEWQPWQLRTPRLRSLLAELNSEPMLRFLEKLTGIQKLIADPYYVGGGLHETRAGGHLSVHADFNIHKGMNVVRRINLLIYLNDDWDDSWGGHLELWSRDMKERRVKVAPVMGRAVIFNTDLDSFHGVPDPVACPPDRARRSLALYYYTSPEEGLRNLPVRTTVFKPRPGSDDKPDREVQRRHLLNDWLPPAIARLFSKH